MSYLFDMASANRQGQRRGVYSVCCAQPMVIEAAMLQAQENGSVVLIEATANQVNQYGGYTGMKPSDFVRFVEGLAQKVGLPMSEVLLGGDHLGPVCWTDEPYEQAKKRSEELIDAYVRAGFKKIHLDTSMPCADDPQVLTDDVVAERAAHLCDIAEKAAQDSFGQSDICYVVGTEVPPPGGAKEEISSIDVTPTHRVQKTYDSHQQAFQSRGLQQAWDRVIALVVQPGVEFDHLKVFDFDKSAATALSDFVKTVPKIVFEAHSTDYQKASAYAELVKAHFAILKVGPQLTFAMREAIFSLSHIEDQLSDEATRSNIRDVLETEMCANPKYWEKFYDDKQGAAALLRKYSFSDRIRYYWNTKPVQDALKTLLSNIDAVEIPLPLISQYFPQQYQEIRQGRGAPRAQSLIIENVRTVLRDYANACG
ncbi:D-tagatose-bisphosphate aldolase, class II, non-catalytic subunit [Lacimicrobium alkaliphilum]|uniref:Tagatose-bisphosphate aldolase subunit KbaZ n=1 Tax=Lacimicrobium alkaliphilum TaxID=1526571 RepID=A0ABQ1RGG9_9ALTE|nr:D-tagatose-bisphosphate aldolase, class II, non-catalytic subunit [Lacimicrobium alkaliphilum]GGD69703.1 tagatose-bisphosphate aldolase subunit KbaZ [Lacimicrobium alkaliphilum]